MLVDDVSPEVPVRALPIAFVAGLLRDVEHDRQGENVVFAGQVYELLPVFGVDVRGIDNRQPFVFEALSGDVVQQIKRIVCDGLVVFVVRDHGPAMIGAEHLGRLEVLSRERGLP